MPEFLHLSPPVEAINILLQSLPENPPAIEKVETQNALGRILAEDLTAPFPLPEFPRSTVDGYALRAKDTFGTSDSLPGYLKYAGEIPMGAAPSFNLLPGQCALIHTGGMIPIGADAVIMVENTQMVEGNNPHDGTGEKPSLTEIEILRAVGIGENVLQVGEDVNANQVVLSTGTKLRPAEIGGCMALGITKLDVARKPVIGLISSGDEVIPPDIPSKTGQVHDVNSYSLAALVQASGGDPKLYGIVPDNMETMVQKASIALSECDALVITAGSSASSRDMTVEAIRRLGSPGVLVHGINVHPGKPTILGVCDGKAVIGLPGNPVSALVIASLFLMPVVGKLTGEKIRTKPPILAKLSVNIASRAGREDWVVVKLVEKKRKELSGDGMDLWEACPVYGKSNFIFSLASADGLVRIPTEVTGFGAGDLVEVILI